MEATTDQGLSNNFEFPVQQVSPIIVTGIAIILGPDVPGASEPAEIVTSSFPRNLG
jgi:hypothetical protein